jgi:hypothetical protein
MGCYEDDSNPRDLNEKPKKKFDVLSPNICASHCGGYKYFGLENGYIYFK